MFASEHLRGDGPVAALEDAAQAWTGGEHVLALSSASAALAALQRVSKLGPGDEVIVSCLAPPETITPSARAGCTIVLADVEGDAPTLDPDSATQCVTARTRLVIGVDLCGVPSDTVALRALADAHNLAYVGDAAQAFGAVVDGYPPSSCADVAVYSLNASKLVSAGEGGLLVTHSERLYQELVRETQHPARQLRDGCVVNPLFLNARINPFGAQAALRELEILEQTLAAMRARAARQLLVIAASGFASPVVTVHGRIWNASSVLAGWIGRPRPGALVHQCAAQGCPIVLRDLPVRSLAEVVPAGQLRTPVSLTNAAKWLRAFVVEEPC